PAYTVTLPACMNPTSAIWRRPAAGVLCGIEPPGARTSLPSTKNNLSGPVGPPPSRAVPGRLGDLRGLAHEPQHDGAERLQLLVVARPLEALLEHDGELPLGEHDVVVDVVDLAPRHLGVAGQELRPG